MKNEFQARLKEYAKGDEDDVVGLFEFSQWIKRTFAITDKESLIRVTCELVGDALDMGYKAGCSPYAQGGFAIWQEQEKAYVLEQVKKEWNAFGEEEPNLTTPIWFGLPGYDYPFMQT